MRLRAADATFDLVVLGYEHPDVTEDTWDSNWLVVNGIVTAGGTSWKFVEPCVTTFELAELAEWLRSLKAAEPFADEHVFTEPALTFVYQASPQRALRVRFSNGAAPPSADGPATLDFPLAELDLDEVIADLRGALIEYPIRGGAA